MIVEIRFECEIGWRVVVIPAHFVSPARKQTDTVFGMLGHRFKGRFWLSECHLVWSLGTTPRELRL